MSSTIKECAAERAVARKAIASINHEPVLFEDVGARPFPPRDLYRPRLEAAHVFIAIYRLKYGWIAPGMEISGIEDEFQLASDSPKERLVYVFDGDGERDADLEALIEKVKDAGITVGFYDDPAQLHERIRDDLTAVLTGRFVEQAAVEAGGLGADELLDAVLPNEAHRLRRPDVEDLVLGSVESQGRTLVVGPLGAGKSVLLAQLAAHHDWVFVDGRGLSRLDLLARIANVLRARVGEGPLTFPSEQSALAALGEAWEAGEPVTLAVDAATSPSLLWSLPHVPENRLVATARQSDSDIPGAQRVEVPALSASEVQTWLTTFRGHRPPAGEAVELVRKSRGNPLYLRFYASGASARELTLQELEVQACRELSPRAQEVLFYLALAGKPLSLGTLALLLGADLGGPESVAGLAEEATALVRQSSGKVSIIHEHPQQTLLDQLEASPARLGFFAGQLGAYFEDTGDYVGAFRVFNLAGERRRADRILDRASQQVAVRGGGDDAVAIFRRGAEVAREDHRTEDEVRSLLALSHALSITGDGTEARAVLESAEAVATSSGLAQAKREVRETRILIDFAREGHAARVDALSELHQEYSEEGLDFHAARITTLLAAEHINAREFEAARVAAQAALEYFETVGDEYGRRVSLTNLAAALIGIDNQDPEALRMARELDEHADPDENPRERAVVCNLLTGRYRQSGDYELAAQYANEAIQIGERLGNQHVIAMNRANLGNVRRDEGKLDEALAEYQAADRVAVGAGLTGDEAFANELIANLLNRRGDHDLALIHAGHAAGLARSLNDPMTLGRALEERALALALLGREEEAVKEFTAATQAVSGLDAGVQRFQSLIEDGLSLCEASRRPELKLEFLRSALGTAEGTTGDHAQGLINILQRSLPEIVRRMGVKRSPAIVALALSDFITEMPVPVQRHVIRLCIDSLLGSGDDAEYAALLTGIAGVLMACPWDGLSLADVVELADRIAARVPGLNFKPQHDGAGHWTLHPRLGGPAIISVHQLDDSPRSAVVTLAVVALLYGLAGPMTELVLQTENAPRREAQIWITGRADFEANVEAELVALGDMEPGFVVTNSTDVTRGDQPPTMVICSDEFGPPWKPTRERLSPLHLLLADLLRTLTHHFLASEVESEVLHPKIIGLLREVGYRGRRWSSADGANPGADSSMVGPSGPSR